MPNLLTRVPDRPAPALGGALRPVVALADLFMAAMLSRPGGLSLRTTWVTPGTMILGSALGVAGVLALVLLLVSQPLTWLAILGVAVCAFFVLGGVCVVATGAAQRTAHI